MQNNQIIEKLKTLLKLSDLKLIHNELKNIIDELETRDEELRLFTDGGSIGNPGPAASAFIVKNESDKIIYKKGIFLGDNYTNNIAEYKAVEYGIKYLSKIKCLKFKLFSDSELLVKQLTGVYKIKNPGLLSIYTNIIKLLDKFEKYEIEYIPREMNKEADILVNNTIKTGNRG